MKIKFIITTIILSLPFTLHCCETGDTTTTHTVIVRPATLNDLEIISQISHQQYQKTFKPMWEKHYAAMTPSHHTIDSFVEEKTQVNDASNKNHTRSQILYKNSDQKLLVAELIQGNQKNIAGYCRFEKKDLQTMYINFIVVAEEFRKRGIAQQLARAAMSTFDGVTECKFRALVHYDFINDLYAKHGCEQIGTISLDATTGQISTDPNAPITHIDYSYTIKK
ncbi:MAG TPA: GNAT family N-acetyltransferase [Candidatus Babeliales bacterium]|nr:GNAT family N-acetyltransferase [Candidatus Babeliales bacterium]